MHEKLVKSVLNKHKQRDSWFLDDYSVNPYEGCSCNCQYCYVRGSKYGENMDDGLAVKINLPAVLEKQLQLRARKSQYGITAIGTATDAYIPLEEQTGLTRRILQLMLKYRFPVFISTKRTLVLRDLDLLKQIDRTAILPADLENSLQRGAILSVSLSSLDEKIAHRLEPGAVPPLERLQLVRELKRNGFLAGVHAMPLLPFISDRNESLEQLVAAASEYGADYILAAGLTLFGEGPADSKTLYYKFLEAYDRKLLPEYNRLYGGNYFLHKQYADSLQQRILPLCRKYNIRNSIIA